MYVDDLDTILLDIHYNIITCYYTINWYSDSAKEKERGSLIIDFNNNLPFPEIPKNFTHPSPTHSRLKRINKPEEQKRSIGSKK